MSNSELDKFYTLIDSIIKTIRDDTIKKGPFSTKRILAKTRKKTSNKIDAHVPLTRIHEHYSKLDRNKLWTVDGDLVMCLLALHYGLHVAYIVDCPILEKFARQFSKRHGFNANLTIYKNNASIKQGETEMIETGNPDFAITEEIVDQILDSGNEAMYVTQSQMWTAPSGYQGNTKRAKQRKAIQSRGDLYVKHNKHNFFEGEGDAKVLTSTFHSEVNSGSNITVETYYPKDAPANYTAQPGDALPGDGAAYDLVKNYFKTMACEEKLIHDRTQNYIYKKSPPQKYLERIDATAMPVIQTQDKRSDLADMELVSISHNPPFKDRTPELTGMILGSATHLPKGIDVNSNPNKIIVIKGEKVQHPAVPSRKVDQLFTNSRAKSVTSALRTVYNRVVYAGFNFKGQGIYSGPVVNYCGIPDGDTIWTDESFAEHYGIPQSLTDLCKKIACE